MAGWGVQESETILFCLQPARVIAEIRMKGMSFMGQNFRLIF
jgi:hypothetical protein